MKNTIKLITTLLIIHFLIANVTAQIAINKDGSDPDASAMLDISSSDKGLLIPRMDSTARNK